MNLIHFIAVTSLFIGSFSIKSSYSLSAYDQTILNDRPVAFWPLRPGIPIDYSGNNLIGAFNKTPSCTLMPNGDTASVFNGFNQSFAIPDNNLLEIVRTGILTVEAWIRPDTLQFKSSEGSGYVWWMGKGEKNQYSWSARMYNYNNSEGRFNRISGYAFNKSGNLGAGSYFQDSITVGEWIMFTFTVNMLPSAGYTKIFKNGIFRDQDNLSGYGIVIQNGTAPMRIGTRNYQSFFQGAISKVAVYDYELTTNQLRNHFNTMMNYSI